MLEFGGKRVVPFFFKKKKKVFGLAPNDFITFSLKYSIQLMCIVNVYCSDISLCSDVRICGKAEKNYLFWVHFSDRFRDIYMQTEAPVKGDENE